jgi:predicted patatin/cPLA2 family phospholipase
VAEGSSPASRTDEAKLALVVEGGGMRGVVSGGMVTALDELGLQSAFDFVVGTSAGALAGAFFIAGQTHMGTSIYYEDLTGREWLDYRRALRGSPIVALDYLIDELMVNHKVLDHARILTSEVPFYAVATRVPEYVPEVLGDFRDEDELMAALRASARIPLVAGKPVSLRGREYIDGSLTEAIPLKAALDLGATHLLVLLTRPLGKVRRHPGHLQRRVAFPMMNRLQAGLGNAYAMRAARYAEELEQLELLQAKSAGGGGHFVFSWPPRPGLSVSSSRIPKCFGEERRREPRPLTKYSPAPRRILRRCSAGRIEKWRSSTNSATIPRRRSSKSGPTARPHKGRMTRAILKVDCWPRSGNRSWTTTMSTPRSVSAWQRSISG